MLTDRREVTYSALQRIEARTNPLIAGGLAGIVIAFDRNGSILDLVVAAGYLRPVYLLLKAYLPQESFAVPAGAPLLELWPWYPSKLTEIAATDLADSLDGKNGLASIIRTRSAIIAGAIHWLFRWTVVVLVVRALEAILLAYAPLPVATRVALMPRNEVLASPIPTPSASPSPKPTPTPKPRPVASGTPVTSPGPRDKKAPLQVR